MSSFTTFIIYFILFFSYGSSAQTTDTIVMVEPTYFGFNAETASSNFFQKDKKIDLVLEKVKHEFAAAVDVLRQHNVRIIVLPSIPGTPDAIFPNNWFSTDKNSNSLILYPMLAANRRKERSLDLLLENFQKLKIYYRNIINLTDLENFNQFLEGTGALILDRDRKIAYVSLSPRATTGALDVFVKRENYTPITFTSYDVEDKVIYHTNVMMSVGKGFAVLCAECIRNKKEREQVIDSIRKSNKKLIVISPSQVNSMCGNILELKDLQDKPLIIMSKTAYNNFSSEQIRILKRFGEIVSINIDTIENIGGGSARCMLAEVFY